MAKEKTSEHNIMLDEETINSTERVQIPLEHKEVTTHATRVSEERDNLINCLRNEKVIGRFISRAKGMITDPRHILFGGMASGSKMRITTPLLRSGGFADVLTKDEKKFLEYKLGLEPNALSVHNRNNNFWSDANEQGIGRVELIKGDNPFDLSNPIDYIKYKILLANKDQIAPSMQALQDKPKATYKFVIINEGDTAKAANTRVTLKARAYMEFGKIQDNADILRTIIETIDGRPTSKNSKIEFLQEKVGKLIQADARLFVRVATDPLLSTKVLIKKAIEGGLISNRGGMLYLKSDGTPLCEDNEEPTMSIAAKYLSMPKHQELMFALQAKLK